MRGRSAIHHPAMRTRGRCHQRASGPEEAREASGARQHFANGSAVPRRLASGRGERREDLTDCSLRKNGGRPQGEFIRKQTAWSVAERGWG